jgi:hypothetical protein
MRYLKGAGQLALIALLFASVATFSAWPAYRSTPSGSAVVMLSFVHGADRKAACRRLTPEEIAKLPPNMRKVQDCPRGRMPIYVELDLNGRTAFSKSLPPTGIAGDGPSRVYERFVVPAGRYDIGVRMRDTTRSDGFDRVGATTVTLAPDQMLVVDFRPERNEFVFR